MATLLSHIDRPRLRFILNDLGWLLHIPALMTIPAFAVMIVAGEWYLWSGLVVTAAVSVGFGQLLARVESPDDGRGLPLPMITVAFAWTINAVIVALPFMGMALMGETANETIAVFQDPLNSLFEAVSGLTSTGLTVSRNPAELPYTIQFWRSLCEWLGGIGMVVLALAIIQPANNADALYRAEARNLHLGNDLKETVRNIWWIYGLYTAAAILFFALAGMPLWEALNHGLTTIATGGFTITAVGFSGYGTAVKWVTIAFMLLGSISFKTHHAIMSRFDWQLVIRRTQLRLYLGLIVVAIVIVGGVNWWRDSVGTFTDDVFQVITAASTSGFSTVDVNEWPNSMFFYLILLMFIGGCAGSTAGGLKIGRLAWIVKGWATDFRALWVKGDEDIRYASYNGQIRESSEALRRIRDAASKAFLFLAMLLISTFLLLVFLDESDFTLQQIIFEAVSAMGGVGLTAGVTSPERYAPARIVLIILMLMGRLEVMAVLVFLGITIGVRMRERHQRFMEQRTQVGEKPEKMPAEKQNPTAD